MKTILMMLLMAGLLWVAGCSRSDKPETVMASPTPNANLQRDAERLQQATAKIAKERERAAQSSPAATPNP